MKRSEINALMQDAKSFFETMNFKLPPWSLWPPSAWKNQSAEVSEIVENQLGWDLTDFGSGDFRQRGLLLFTIRNGNVKRDQKTYAEKIMIVEENQETPLHFHRHKMEDIINRGGGNLVLELYNATEKETCADTPVQVSIDGLQHVFQAGEKVVLKPGESICLYRKLYHRFYGEAGRGRILVGEVSMVNDDNTDNRFLEPLGRFPDIDEDVNPLHLLVGDYARYL